MNHIIKTFKNSFSKLTKVLSFSLIGCCALLQCYSLEMPFEIRLKNKEKFPDEHSHIYEVGKTDISATWFRTTDQSVAFSIKKIDDGDQKATYLNAHVELGIPSSAYHTGLPVKEDVPLVLFIDNETYALPLREGATTNFVNHGFIRDKRVIDADYQLNEKILQKLKLAHTVSYKISFTENFNFEIEGTFTHKMLDSLKKM